MDVFSGPLAASVSTPVLAASSAVATNSGARAASTGSRRRAAVFACAAAGGGRRHYRDDRPLSSSTCVSSLWVRRTVRRLVIRTTVYAAMRTVRHHDGPNFTSDCVVQSAPRASNGPNHLGLWPAVSLVYMQPHGLSSITTALITSDCGFAALAGYGLGRLRRAAAAAAVGETRATGMLAETAAIVSGAPRRVRSGTKEMTQPHV